MARAVFRNARIAGIAAAVPTAAVDNAADHVFCPEEDRRKIIALTGVSTYRIAPSHICASDLCEAAARQLLRESGRNAIDIDAIVFVSMTPDYRVPSTACLLQSRLQCPVTTIAYDVNMGCSGYVVGLMNALALIQGAGLRNVLLLTGDTQTKLCHRQDKNVTFILGDAGTATLLEVSPGAPDITVELFTDGSRFQNLYVPAGGFRNPSTDETRQVRSGADGGLRSDDNLFMNGMEIFKFSSTDVVRSLIGYMESGGLKAEDFSYLFLHQANKFMNDKIAGKLKFPKEKVPYSIQSYGNTGSASIPLTIAYELSRKPPAGSARSLLCGFGVGLSWGIADVVLEKLCTPAIIECA